VPRCAPAASRGRGAREAGLGTEAFEDFYFKVCTLDYSRMTPGMKALADLMRKTDQVHIKGPGTDLRFSIKGIGAQPCGGLRNIPDEGFYSFDPTCYFGVYMPDTFWFDRPETKA